VTAPAPDPALSGVFGIPAVTPAVERAAEAIVREEGVIDWDVLSERLREHPRGQARAALAAALDVEEMAPFFDPSIVEPARSKVMAAWRAHDLDAERYMASAEAEATKRATALRAAILGSAS